MSEVISLDDHRPKPQRGGNNKGTRRSFGNIRKLPSDRYQASYLAPDGTRHNGPTTFPTLRAAEKWLSMRSAEITEHRWKPAPPPEVEDLTFGDYSTRWLAGRDLQPRTRSEYEKILAAALAPMKRLKLRDITSKAVRDWYDKLDPKTKTARAHAYSLLRTILSTAVDDELIEVNPCRIRGAGHSKRTKRPEPATLDELKLLADAMPERYRAMVHVAAWCALRFGELTELRRKDVLLDQGLLRVRRAVTWPSTKTPVIGLPKSEAGVRDVAIPPHIIPLLRAHLDEHAVPGAEGLVFPNTKGEHMHHGSLYKVFKPARAKAGRPDLRWHDLRHTGATMAARSGATLAELMNRLGHSTVGAALVYQHAADDRDKEIAKRLSAMALQGDE